MLYTLPNLYDAAPAVQVSSGKSTTKVDPALLARVKETLEAQKIKADFVELDGTNIRARFGMGTRSSGPRRPAEGPQPGGWRRRLHGDPQPAVLDPRRG